MSQAIPMVAAPAYGSPGGKQGSPSVHDSVDMATRESAAPPMFTKRSQSREFINIAGCSRPDKALQLQDTKKVPRNPPSAVRFDHHHLPGTSPNIARGYSRLSIFIADLCFLLLSRSLGPRPLLHANKNYHIVATAAWSSSSSSSRPATCLPIEFLVHILEGMVLSSH